LKWQDYSVETKTYQLGDEPNEDRGVLLRYQDATHHYRVAVVNDSGIPPNSELEIVLVNGGETELASIPLVYDHNEWYHLKTQVQGNVIKANYRKDGDAEPAWMLEVTDGASTFVDGKIGLRANGAIGRFDDVLVGDAE